MYGVVLVEFLQRDSAGILEVPRNEKLHSGHLIRNATTL